MSNLRQPNFLLIVVDDMGYSDCEPFGGEIRTPNLQQLADHGVRFRHFHVSSLCAPTRSMLLSGCDNHHAGLGAMPTMHATNQYMQPGYEGYLNANVLTIPEILKDAGYHTYMAGKWHLGEHEERRPHARGFERTFSFLGGGVSHFNDQRALSAFEQPHTKYSEDGRTVENLPPDFYSSDYYTDKMMQYIAEQNDQQPFFAYLAFTSPHDPLQVPANWLDKYKGVYDGGYDVIKEKRRQRMKELGLIPETLTANEGSGLFKSWGELTGDERIEAARKMEIYAAMIENLDWNLGRLFDKLKELNQFDDTIIFFLSDNGANPKEPSFYAPNTEPFINSNFDNSLENYGKINSFISIGPAWAEVANTPLSYFKLTTYEGGTQTPLIVSGKRVHKRGVVTDELLHVTDLLPTILDFANLKYPQTSKNLKPLYGTSLKPYLQEETKQSVRNDFDVLGFEMGECKAVIKGDWKLIFMPPPYGTGNTWHLYNLKEDLKEEHDLAAEFPAKFNELMADWQAYAISVGYIKSNGDPALAKLGFEEFYRFDPKNRIDSGTETQNATREAAQPVKLGD
ncbi:arylsulfatase [Adhaeribacter sp. BT258]|uniref:Arylsulfatase n=1 Tax=Adhaeribacter terrigena TaxID=2793070 RepID=A0ABS1C3I6_9BACT|nr:arylsulfatase [Adhaeribacter terrigena]MBK0403966.1 arylsulfatase [Adhaeribacter terrigena]